MNVALVLLGGLLVAVAMADAIVTTLAAGNGGGPLTARTGKWLWAALRAVDRGRNGRLLSYAGMVVLLASVLVWVVLLWAGWALVFSSTDAAVLSSTDKTPASVAARIYYAAFVVFTLGIGDFVPGSGSWQIVTGLASFLGLFLVTLSITYLVSVVSAAVSRRALARAISVSGETGVDIVLLHWDGKAISSQLSSLTQSLSTQILQVTQQHLAYPVLHHFHAESPASSAPRALAALDDALLLLQAGVAPDVRPSSDSLTRLQRTLEHYAGTVGGSASGDREPPALPSLQALRDSGVPTVSDDEYAEAARDHGTRRAGLDELVTADAWTWPSEQA